MRILPFVPALAPAFSALNRAWIERLFTLEAADLKVLQDPYSAIIAPGGQIFFALEGEIPVGTAAALRIVAGHYELAKMAVDPTYQGAGIGYLLGRAVIDWVREQGAARLYLETNSALAGAIRLYQRLGFRHAPPHAESEYARADVYMEMVF
jgi:GNAT superfamily N-acetyltransferase